MTLPGIALALVAAASLSAQTVPPTSPYAARTAQPWPNQAVYQSPATPQAGAGQVLPAAYQAEPSPPGTPPTASANGGTASAQAASPAMPERSKSPPLPPRGSSTGTTGSSAPGKGLPSAVTVASSLAVVLGLFLVLAWAMRRATPGEASLLPGEVVEVLGRKVISQRQQLQLLRCGRKLLLVSVTADGAETLTEITDPEEVDRLAGLCQQARPGSATATFRQVMRQFSNERTEGRDG